MTPNLSAGSEAICDADLHNRQANISVSAIYVFTLLPAIRYIALSLDVNLNKYSTSRLVIKILLILGNELLYRINEPALSLTFECFTRIEI